jgi:hypothetical protein
MIHSNNRTNLKKKQSRQFGFYIIYDTQLILQMACILLFLVLLSQLNSF